MITKAGVARAIAKRQAYKPIPIVLDEKFTSQNNLINDPARFLVAQCSRRAGKTNAIAIRFFKTLEKYPKSQCLYLSLTQESARGIMWPVLIDLNDKHKLGCTFTESSLTMTHPNGSKLKLMGADLKDFIKRLKGRKYPGVAVDEAQDFGSHLQSLIDDVLTPSIVDYPDSWLLLTGTPGPVPQGFFFDITQNAKYGFSLHKWTILENPYIEGAQEFIKDLKSKREWQDDHPTLRREWLNEWVLDVQALWIRYTAATNHYQQLPALPMGQKWNHIMGIDLGFKDADAIAVLAWSDAHPATYLVEEKITSKQGITELVTQVEELSKKYDVYKMVIDEGGLGKKIAEEIRRQKGIPVEQADKAQKQQNVEFLNDALRLGKFRAKSASRFALDSYLVQIDWDKSRPDKIVIKKKPHSDIIDAVLYAFKESPAYAYQAPKAAPKYGTKEWADNEEHRMFNDAVDHFEKLAELEGKLNGYDQD